MEMCIRDSPQLSSSLRARPVIPQIIHIAAVQKDLDSLATSQLQHLGKQEFLTVIAPLRAILHKGGQGQHIGPDHLPPSAHLLSHFPRQIQLLSLIHI